MKSFSSDRAGRHRSLTALKPFPHTGKGGFAIAASLLVMILIWELASLAAGSEQLLPGPWQTLKSTASLLFSARFLKTAGTTLLRGLAGFVLAGIAAVLTGIAGGLSNTFHSFVKPWVVMIRSTPVIAFVLLAIIWFSPDTVPVFIGLLTMFPIVYLNISEGIRSTDRKLVEMAHFYGIRGWRLVKELYLPAIEPYAVSGISNAVGIGWRAMVVGEVLSQPQWGIGTAMHSAQTFLQVDMLFAWTLITVLFGAAFERLLRIAEIRITGTWT